MGYMETFIHTELVQAGVSKCRSLSTTDRWENKYTVSGIAIIFMWVVGIGYFSHKAYRTR